MATEYTRKEKSLLRQLRAKLGESELTGELEKLFESFCTWVDNGISAFEKEHR